MVRRFLVEDIDTRHLDFRRLATADTVMAEAAPDLGIEVVRFT